MKYLAVKNWNKFQHYKDRNPPWIKLHRTLLNDYDFGCLQDASKLHLMLIWLLASQTDGRIPDDPEFLRGKLGLKAKPDLIYLRDHGFLIPIMDASKTLALDASSVLATCPLETETETETEKEKSMRANGALPDWIPEGPWKSWLEVRSKMRAPNTPRALHLAINQLDKLRRSGYEPSLILENATLRGWRGLFPVKSQENTSAPLVQVCAKCGRPAGSLIQTSDGRLCPTCRGM